VKSDKELSIAMYVGRKLVTRFNRKIFVRLAAVAAALVAVFGLANPAHASVYTGGTFDIVHEQNDYCLDSNSSFQVYMLPCNGGNYQKWTVTLQSPPCGDGECTAQLTLKDVATGYCLDSNGTSLYTHVCGSDYQVWTGSDVRSTLQQVVTDVCLDGSGTSVYVLACNGGAYQNWNAQ
jgi:hypothetical protein